MHIISKLNKGIKYLLALVHLHARYLEASKKDLRLPIVKYIPFTAEDGFICKFSR